MGFSLRTITDNIRFEQAVTLNALERAIPQTEVEAVIEDLGVREERVRKLPAFVMLLLCIGIFSFAHFAATMAELSWPMWLEPHRSSKADPVESRCASASRTRG